MDWEKEMLLLSRLVVSTCSPRSRLPTTDLYWLLVSERRILWVYSPLVTS